MSIDYHNIPSLAIIKDETEHTILSFCSLCNILQGKKLSLQNVFIAVLKDSKYREVLKDLLDVDSDFELVRFFIDYDSTITKSKYVTKYINSRPKDSIFT